jgi:hypothetical protein
MCPSGAVKALRAAALHNGALARTGLAHPICGAVFDRTSEIAQPRRTRAVVCSGVIRSEKAFVSQCAPEAPIGVTFRQKVLRYQRTA